jgi:alpha/beta superfamily hydrolase
LTDAIGVMRQQSIVMVRDMLTGEILAEKTFTGANPDFRCPPTKQYGLDNFGFGEMVDNEKIIAWVRQVLADY